MTARPPASPSSSWLARSELIVVYVVFVALLGRKEILSSLSVRPRWDGREKARAPDHQPKLNDPDRKRRPPAARDVGRKVQ